ncbi:DUF4352 domain-containing protein [Streptomyces sp. NPDC021224]|uniref:DUF4352 domain-containing protein n=1 Tax=unclassified Streptomyces TaxID=2593676 RepID=UPI0037B75214
MSEQHPNPNTPHWAQPQPQQPMHTGWVTPPLAPLPPKRHRAAKIAGGIVGAIIVISVIGAVAANGKKGGTNSTPAQAAPAQTAPAASTETTSPEPAAPVKKKPAVAAYGDTYTYTDGLAITVSKVAKYTPGQYAAGAHHGDKAVVLTVKITNGTGKPFDTTLLSVNVKAGADGEAAEDIFDLDNTIGDGFSGTVVPAATATAKFAYDIPKSATGKLDIEVQPDSGLEYESWHWVGQMP